MARSVKILSLSTCNIHFLLDNRCPGQRQKDAAHYQTVLSHAEKKVNDRIHSLILLFIVSPILVLPVIHLDDYRRCGVVVEPKRKARVAFVRSFASFFSFNPFTSPSHQTLWILTTGTMTMTMTLT